MRLQKYIAACGVTSRRKAEELILEGRVQINNKIVTELGTKVNLRTDKVKVDDRNIKLEKNDIYIVLNKPVGVITTVKDEKGRDAVVDLIEDVEERIYPVGRLDADTTGVLILTNDGDFAHKLMHPSFEVEKRYIAIVEGVPNRAELEKFRNGVFIDGKKTSKADVKIAKRYDEDSILEITIHEGRNRQVKKMCEAINHPVKKLKRISVGEVEIGGLQPGEWRFLEKDEIEFFKNL